ncbi:MAG: 30S ribosomal protein S16 [Planctomycetota bacterium]|mgnify:FL=1|jgi:small subunit ribosomal protein S16
MSVRLKLKRYGRRHQPHYRLTAVDRRRTRDTKVIEELGLYDPLNQNAELQVALKRERIEYWLSVGAQPTETVRRLLEKQGVAIRKK